MFDVGLSEMMVIAVVALVVLGPERLPKVARTLGHLIGRAQRYVNQVKQDINREMELGELKKLQEEVKSAAQEMQQSVNEASRSVEAEARSFEQSVNSSVAELEAKSPNASSWDAQPPEVSVSSAADAPTTFPKGLLADRIDPR
jgi:sec-independent protein translocase protein TatB